MEPKAERSILATVVGGVARLLVSNGASKATLLGFEFVIATALGAAGYGVFSIGFATIIVVARLSLLGAKFGVVQYLSIYQEEGRRDLQASVVRTSFGLAAVVGTGVGALISLRAEWLALTVFDDPALVGVLAVVGLIIPFEAMNQALGSAFRGRREFVHYVVVFDFARNLVLLVSVPFAIALGLSLPQIFQVFLAGSVVATLYGGLTMLRSLPGVWRPRRADLGTLVELVRFSYLLFFADLLRFSSSRVLVLLGGVYMTSAEVGVLAVVLRFIAILYAAHAAIGLVSPVEFARLYFREDHREFAELARSISYLLTTVSIAVAIPMLVDPQTTMGLMGADYVVSSWVVWSLVGIMLINVTTGPINVMLISAKRQVVVFAMTGVELILLAAVVIPAMSAYGFGGAVWGETARMAALILTRHFLLVYSLDARVVDRRLLSLCGAGALAIGVGIFAATFAAGLPGFVLGVLAGEGVYALYVLLSASYAATSLSASVRQL